MSPKSPRGTAKTFSPAHFLSNVGNGKTLVQVRKDTVLFSQGDVADAVYYLQEGKIKLSVVSQHGKEAVIAILDHSSFFGESCLSGQAIRVLTAMALTDGTVMRIEKRTMTEFLHNEPALAEMFVAYLLSRNIRMEEDLVDQLFNSSEKRLARVLLLLAHFGKDQEPEPVIPKISQETLAEMVGTTRSRVSFFLNKFRRLGFIEYNGELRVHKSLLNIVLHD